MKRFYKEVSVEPTDAGFGVRLDGRAVKTVGGRPQVVPSKALAQAMAAEWAGQGEEIDTRVFLLRDMADYALDVVAADPTEAMRALVPYAETDTLCYRADPDEAVWQRQQAVWEPILTGAEARYGLRFERVSGIIARPQPAETMARVEDLLAGKDAFALAALRNLAGLAASLVTGLLALEEDADLAALWDAAHLEENWQIELWGSDYEAEQRQEKRRAAFMAAAEFARLARG
ncbi:ATP12 family chaperone protein [Novosphingobium terrae]|uniref:ATP12 family chaperone protein n=1 Tax=Novosphingobium terrae TaxID=2726189 RepID=UPI00197CDAC4|nr:ATP12 family protein [Novosphingobium terrae]